MSIREKQVEEKHRSVGRPRKYQTPEDMQKAIDDFFDNTELITITGLALHLGFTSRQDLINYENYSPEFYDTLKKAKLRIENDYEKGLKRFGGSGNIFALKNFGWQDQQAIDHTTQGDKVNFNVVMFKDKSDA